MESTLTTRQSQQLLDKQEARDLEAAKIASGMKESTLEREPSETTVPQAAPEGVLSEEEDPTVYESRLYTHHLYNEVFGNNEELQTAVALGYAEDPLFSKVSQRLAEFPAFEKEGNFLWGKNRGGERVLCVPNAKLGTKQ